MRVSVGDVRLFFEVSGAEWLLGEDGMLRRPVLIGLHGGPGLDGTKMRYQLASLADTMQVVVPDQRGHGRSDLSTSDSWNLATWAMDVRGLSDALGIERPIVFGSSFGGFVAQQYAASQPDHPAGLILQSRSHQQQVAGLRQHQRIRLHQLPLIVGLRTADLHTVHPCRGIEDRVRGRLDRRFHDLLDRRDGPVRRLRGASCCGQRESAERQRAHRSDHAARTVTSIVPIRSMEAETTSPGWIGLTPSGVPVMITSPGCNV